MVSYEKNVNSEIETDKENGQDGFCFLLYGAIEAIVLFPGIRVCRRNCFYEDVQLNKMLFN